MQQLTVVYIGSSKPQYGAAWMRAAVKARHDADHAKSGPREELKLYLSSPLEHVENVVLWWGVRDHHVVVEWSDLCF
jgi:hypothetical protein